MKAQQNAPAVATRPTILITAGYYLPGFKGGGPIQSLANMVEKLGDEFDFRIVTSDRDQGDEAPYQALSMEVWQSNGKAKVLYFPPGGDTLAAWRGLIREIRPAVLYLNSFFSFAFTIKLLLLRRLGLIPPIPVFVAPRGEFAPAALGLRRFKKKVYIALAQVVGLYQDVVWQASSPFESEDIRRRLGRTVEFRGTDSIVVLPDLAPPIGAFAPGQRLEKAPGTLRLLILGRITRMKNIDGALRMLTSLTGNIQVDIVGPIQDEAYWSQCQEIVGSMGRNIQIRHSGAVSHDRVVRLLCEHDFLFQPSLGENFGHVIVEAMLAGCPPLISDRTPWRGLEEKGVGWDIPLEAPDHYRRVLQECVSMDMAAHRKMSRAAREFGLRMASDEEHVDSLRQLLRRLASRQEAPF